MHIVDNWKTVVTKRFAQFSGRAGRAEFWWFELANLSIAIVLLLLALAVDALLVVYIVYVLATLIPTYAVMARRLRDTGKSGWMIFIGAIPIVGLILLIVFLATDGDPGRNQYGNPVPYGA